MPKFNLTSAEDPKTTLASLKFQLKSCKFGRQSAEHYNPIFETKYSKSWKQLEIGENESDKDSSTIFCGGSVSAIDWAPTSGELNFLAVACNISKEGIKMNLTGTVKSCVQLYEFSNLTNDKCVKFTAPDFIQS